MEEGKEIDLKNVKEHEYEDEDTPAPQRPNGVKKPGQK
jgi:hypothetical protein